MSYISPLWGIKEWPRGWKIVLNISFVIGFILDVITDRMISISLFTIICPTTIVVIKIIFDFFSK